jgi:hypothetical protein
MALSFGVEIKRPQAPSAEAHGPELGHGISRAECSVVTIHKDFRDGVQHAPHP